MKDEKIVVTINGKNVECDVLFTFDCEDTNKSYVGYTDHTLDKEGRKKIYASAFDPIFGMGTLEEIETEEEWEMINNVIENIKESVSNSE